jgi:hypothetical protein
MVHRPLPWRIRKSAGSGSRTPAGLDEVSCLETGCGGREVKSGSLGRKHGTGMILR